MAPGAINPAERLDASLARLKAECLGRAGPIEEIEAELPITDPAPQRQSSQSGFVNSIIDRIRFGWNSFRR